MGAVFPLKLDKDHGIGHSFCPAKLFRDDPLFVEWMDKLWLSWKLGKVPSGDGIDSMEADDAEALTVLIRTWEDKERINDFAMLSRVLGGDPDKKEIKPRKGK